MRRLNRLVPDAEKELATAQLGVAKDVAGRIASRAPVGATGDYKRSIEAALLSSRPKREQLGLGQTKDKNATGVFADYIWRFLEFGTSASAGAAPARDRRYKSRIVMTKGKRAHAATAPQAHIFPTWRAFKKTARRRMAAAVRKAVKKAQG